MELVPERYHWLNTILGILDQAFSLTDEEQMHVTSIVNHLLDVLDIPDRGAPANLPPPLVLEVQAGYYTAMLCGPRDSGLIRPGRYAGEADIVVPLETWRESLIGLITTAYQLGPLDLLTASKVLTDMLAALGIPARAASFFPDNVVKVARSLDTR